MSDSKPRGRNDARMVGESYRDCVERLAGERRAAELDVERVTKKLREAQATIETLRGAALAAAATPAPPVDVAAADAYAAAHGMDPKHLSEEDADGIAAVRQAIARALTREATS